MSIRAFFSILPLLLLAGVCQAQPDAYSAESVTAIPDFAGSWEVDYERSESTEEKLRYLYDITRSHYERQISRRDQNFDAVQAARENLQRLIDLGRFAEIVTRPQVLTIEQSRDDILIERQGNFALTCDFDNRKTADNALGKEVCTWDEDQLVFHLELPGGLAVNHRLAMSRNGERLNLATTVVSETISQRFSINRVYRPFEPGEGLYECEFTLAKKKTCYLRTPD